MSKLSDKVSYLRGLAEGTKLDASTNEGKILSKIIEVLGEVSEKIDALDEGFEELSDYVECIDDDLQSLEELTDEDDDDDDEDDDDEDFDFDDEDDDDEDECECDHCRISGFESDEDDEELEDEDDADIGMYSGCLCSECGGMFSVDAGFDEEQLFVCPHCGKKVKAIRMNCNNVPVAETAPEDEE